MYIIESCKSVVFGHASPSTPLKEEEAKGAPYSGGAREGSPLVNRLNLQQFFGTKTKNVWCWRHNFLESFTVEYLLFYQNLTMKKLMWNCQEKKSLGSIDLFVFFYLFFFSFFSSGPWHISRNEGNSFIWWLEPFLRGASLETRRCNETPKWMRLIEFWHPFPEKWVSTLSSLYCRIQEVTILWVKKLRLISLKNFFEVLLEIAKNLYSKLNLFCNRSKV